MRYLALESPIIASDPDREDYVVTYIDARENEIVEAINFQG